MLLSIILLVVGLALLIGGGDALVRGASAIAAHIGVSPLVIGLTVVAFGTSAPELAVNVSAAITGNSEISFGNIIGSNMANIGLILGLTALFSPIAIHGVIIRRELPMMNLATLAVIVMAADLYLRQQPNLYDRSDGIILLLLFGVFMFYTAQDALAQRKQDAFLNEVEQAEGVRVHSWWLDILLTLGGLVALCGGGKVAVDAAVDIATRLEVPQVIIGLTILAVGTSLPELATSIIAAWRGQSDLAVGNIVGSNLFNLLLILGITSVVAPVEVPKGGHLDLLFLLLLSLLLLPSAASFGRRITRLEGGAFLFAYLGYTLWRTLSTT